MEVRNNFGDFWSTEIILALYGAQKEVWLFVQHKNNFGYLLSTEIILVIYGAQK